MRRTFVIALLALAVPAALAADDCRRMEAEDFSRIDGSFELVHDPTASGDGTTVGPPNGTASQGNDHALYSFRPAKDGTYYFRAEVHTPTGADDSYCVRITDSLGNVLSPSTPGQCGGDTYWDFWAQSGWHVFELRDGWNTLPPSAQQIVYLNLNGGEVYNFRLGRRENGTFLNWLEYCRKTSIVADPDRIDEEVALDAPDH